jgi:hypothetical protein
MTKSEKRYAVFYKSKIMESSPSGQMLIYTQKKYAEASIWNNVTRFIVSNKVKLNTPKIPNYKIAEFNRKFAKEYSVKPITITYKVPDE